MTLGLDLRELSKRYTPESWALESLNLVMKPGELLTVVGPSGCGKSTLLRLVAGLEEVTSGEMILDGKRLNDLPPKNRDIALMFQSYTLFPHLTLADNMAFGLVVRGMSQSAARLKVIEVARTLGLDGLLNRMPAEISGGERQRAALARALLRRPKLFLFDEPLSSLDAALRAQLRVEIGRLHRELEASMLFVTHDQNEALTLGDRVAVLNKGRLQQISDATTLYQEPANRFVAGFIGNPGMGFFEGQCEMGPQGWNFHNSVWNAPVPLPEEVVRKHPALEPGPVVMGLRPEHLEMVAGEAQGPVLIGRLTVTERWGDFSLHYLKTANGDYAVRSTSGLTFPIGSEIRCHGKLSQVRLFDGVTGKSLATGYP